MYSKPCISSIRFEDKSKIFSANKLARGLIDEIKFPSHLKICKFYIINYF